MKTILAAILFVATLGIGLFAADAPSTQETKKPINKMCAVETKDEVDPAVTVEYKGKTIGFCCDDCIKKFESNPDSFAANLK